MAQIHDIPNGPHYAVIAILTVHTPGDERSRTSPGHGYPASTDTYLEYKAFKDQAEWQRRIESLTRSGTPFRAISATPAKVETKVTVTVS